MNQAAGPETPMDDEGELLGPAPADAADPVLLAFKKDLDQTLLIENLRLTPAQRGERFLKSMRLIYELRRAGEKLRKRPDKPQT